MSAAPVCTKAELSANDAVLLLGFGQAGKQVVQSLKRGNIGHAINPFLPEMALKRGHNLAGFATKSATDFQIITI